MNEGQQLQNQHQQQQPHQQAAVVDWAPQAEGLQQVIQLLKDSQSIDNTVQKNVQKVRFLS